MYKYTLWLCLLFPVLSFAQSKQKSFYSISIGAGLTGASTSSSSEKIVSPKTGQTYKAYNDSVSANQTSRLNLSLAVWYNYSLADKWDLQAGIGYMDVGFRRQQNDIQVGDYTYPGIGDGQLLDFSNSKKNINYDYRFHYVQIPVWMNYRIHKSKDFRTTTQLTGGLTADFLVAHRLTARLDNFTVDSRKKFQLDSTGYDARILNMQLNFGFKVEHKVDKNTTMIIQPMAGFHPFSATNSEIKVRPYYFMLNVGLVFDLNKFRD